jgi:hypothetical protein
VEERLALVGGHLLGVVQQRERPHARTAQRSVVEEHAGDDERSSERPSPGLVRARDIADAEASIEPEETLAGGPSHAAEDSR